MTVYVMVQFLMRQTLVPTDWKSTYTIEHILFVKTVPKPINDKLAPTVSILCHGGLQTREVRPNTLTFSNV
jgi:hypothetical protein